MFGCRWQAWIKEQCDQWELQSPVSPFLLPGFIEHMKKVTDFYNSGGMVVFTTRLPHKSCETGKDSEIDSLVQTIFPLMEDNAWEIIENEKGGKACFLPDPDAVGISEIMYGSGLEFDVSYPLNPDIQYIHKVVDSRNIYFFTNLGKSSIQTEVTLRGKNSGWGMGPAYRWNKEGWNRIYWKMRLQVQFQQLWK